MAGYAWFCFRLQTEPGEKKLQDHTNVTHSINREQKQIYLYLVISYHRINHNKSYCIEIYIQYHSRYKTTGAGADITILCRPKRKAVTAHLKK